MTTLSAIYNELKPIRQQHQNVAHKSAVLTVPSILPREGQSRDTLPHNFQSIGARGANNLSSKLMLTLFPPTLPFMRLEIDPQTMQVLAAEPDQQSKILQSLTQIEEQVASEFDTEGWRPAIAEALRLLVVTGSALVYDRDVKSEHMRSRPAVFDLRQFVVDRDPEFNLLKVVLRQEITLAAAQSVLGDSVTPEQLASISTAPATSSSGAQQTQEPLVELFTGAVRMENGKFSFWQEVGGIMIPGSHVEKKEEDLPLLPLTFAPIYGAAYGRSYVEEFHGDLLALESISRALIEGAAVMSKIIWLIKPGSTTKASTLAKTPNGGIRQGDGDDISTMQAEKSADFSIAAGLRSEIKRDLSNIFLLNSSVQRSGERVTAEEIRFVSQELEDALGGVYAALADTVQRPVTMYFFSRLKRRNTVKIPDSVTPVIATGLESISRNHKVLRITEFLGTLQQMLGPEQVAQTIRNQVVARDLATALNLDAAQYILTDDEIKQNQQAAQQQAAVEALGPSVINNLPAPDEVAASA